MNTPQIVSPEEWEAARQQLLVKEKEHTRAGDALAAERRRMPMVAVEKDYAFEGPDGTASLLDLFDGRRQLIVYRFFFDPGMECYPEEGCGGCSMYADQVSHLAHLRARDTNFVVVVGGASGAHPAIQGPDGLGVPLVHHDRRLLRGLRRGRMARHATSSCATATASSAPTSCTTAATRRMGSTWSFLDITPYGRQEEWEDSPEGYPQTAPYQWWDYHDKYEERGMIAHVSGLPLEELLPAVTGAAGLLLARLSVALRARRSAGS